MCRSSSTGLGAIANCLRLAEFGNVHRYEPSGALHGLMRVRGFTQDDAHIFCTEDQMQAECLKINDLILSTYKDFGSSRSW